MVINIGRQIGSGGRIVARMLADEFGCSFYDRELLNLAARESGFSEKFFEQTDEHKGFRNHFFTLTLHFLAIRTSTATTSQRRDSSCSRVRL